MGVENKTWILKPQRSTYLSTILCCANYLDSGFVNQSIIAFSHYILRLNGATTCVRNSCTISTCQFSYLKYVFKTIPRNTLLLKLTARPSWWFQSIWNTQSVKPPPRESPDSLYQATLYPAKPRAHVRLSTLEVQGGKQQLLGGVEKAHSFIFYLQNKDNEAGKPLRPVPKVEFLVDDYYISFILHMLPTVGWAETPWLLKGQFGLVDYKHPQ